MVHFPQALREEEEILKQKREQYEEELKENEHQQHQMELCGQGLEMKLREQGTGTRRVGCVVRSARTHSDCV